MELKRPGAHRRFAGRMRPKLVNGDHPIASRTDPPPAKKPRHAERSRGISASSRIRMRRGGEYSEHKEPSTRMRLAALVAPARDDGRYCAVLVSGGGELAGKREGSPAKPATGHRRTPDDPLGDDNRTRQYQPTQDAQRFIQISRRPGTSKRPRTWCGGVLLVTCRQRRTAYSLIQAFQNISPCWVCGLKPWRSADRELRLAASPTLIIGTSS